MNADSRSRLLAAKPRGASTMITELLDDGSRRLDSLQELKIATVQGSPSYQLPNLSPQRSTSPTPAPKPVVWSPLTLAHTSPSEAGYNKDGRSSIEKAQRGFFETAVLGEFCDRSRPATTSPQSLSNKGGPSSPKLKVRGGTVTLHRTSGRASPVSKRGKVGSVTDDAEDMEPPATPTGKSRLKSKKSAKRAVATAAEVTMSANELRARADALMDTLLLKGHRTLEVLLGEHLHNMAERQGMKDTDGKFLETLLRDWDPNRDGTISKMEFRQDVRKLVPGTDVKDADRLFESFDEAMLTGPRRRQQHGRYCIRQVSGYAARGRYQ